MTKTERAKLNKERRAELAKVIHLILEDPREVIEDLERLEAEEAAQDEKEARHG